MEKDIDIIVWDLETTGFVAPTSKILEIGCLIIKDGRVEQKHWVLQNNVEIPDDIINLTGITPEIIALEGRNPSECLLEFLPLLKRAKVNVTHNGLRFDIPFLIDYATDVLGWSPLQQRNVLNLLRSVAFDTAVSYKALKTGEKRRENEQYLEFSDRVMLKRVFGLKFNLGVCCDHYGIDRSNVKQHRAMGDVMLTHQLYQKLIGNNDAERPMTVGESAIARGFDDYFAKEDAEAVNELEKFIEENNG
jgi:DNA polymerase III epsilon subunit-like protein